MCFSWKLQTSGLGGAADSEVSIQAPTSCNNTETAAQLLKKKPVQRHLWCSLINTFQAVTSGKHLRSNSPVAQTVQRRLDEAVCLEAAALQMWDLSKKSTISRFPKIKTYDFVYSDHSFVLSVCVCVCFYVHLIWFFNSVNYWSARPSFWLSFIISTDGYAFSQDENGVVSQSEVIRAYDTTKQRTNAWWGAGPRVHGRPVRSHGSRFQRRHIWSLTRKSGGVSMCLQHWGEEGGVCKRTEERDIV